ncbi:MAG: alpha-ribazole phosphatase family protein [Pseudomonadota bacterium]
MSVVLVRHTRLAIAKSVCYGQTDCDVADSFPDDVLHVLPRIEPFDVLVTSPLTRCQKLAEEIATVFNVVPLIDERVQEMNFGAWEGKAWSEVPIPELDLWAGNFLHARPHGGESVAMFRARVLEALQEFNGSKKRHTVVTHAGVIRVAMAPDQDQESFNHSVDYGGVVELDFQKVQAND